MGDKHARSVREVPAARSLFGLCFQLGGSRSDRHFLSMMAVTSLIVRGPRNEHRWQRIAAAGRRTSSSAM
jgi:hypothetical protein